MKNIRFSRPVFWTIFSILIFIGLLCYFQTTALHRMAELREHEIVWKNASSIAIPINEADRVCTVDEDCVPAHISCNPCSYTDGAVHKSFQEQYGERYKTTCERFSLLYVDCYTTYPEPRPVCRAKRCEGSSLRKNMPIVQTGIH